jgi:hypothetical protein
VKRRIAKLGLFLLLGAIVNVAVAWASAWRENLSWPDQVFEGWFDHPRNERLWNVRFFKQAGAAEFWSDNMLPDIVQDRLRQRLTAGDQLVTGQLLTLQDVPAWSRFHSNGAAGNLYTVWHEYAYGWPSLALMRFSDNFHQVNNKVVPTHGLPPVRTEKAFVLGSKALPLGVHWPGFAVNTVFYAVILWLMFAGPGRVRRWRRVRRGLCPACGYSVGPGTSAVCSECGKPKGSGALQQT